jgi:alkylhydroperoxidase family enzyme
MVFIEQISEDQAEGILKAQYDAAKSRAGGVANIIRIMSLDVKSLQASMHFYVALMKSPNALGSARREMLAAVVSNVNGCYY